MVNLSIGASFFSYTKSCFKFPLLAMCFPTWAPKPAPETFTQTLTMAIPLFFSSNETTSTEKGGLVQCRNIHNKKRQLKQEKERNVGDPIKTHRTKKTFLLCDLFSLASIGYIFPEKHIQIHC